MNSGGKYLFFFTKLEKIPLTSKLDMVHSILVFRADVIISHLKKSIQNLHPPKKLMFPYLSTRDTSIAIGVYCFYMQHVKYINVVMLDKLIISWPCGASANVLNHYHSSCCLFCMETTWIKTIQIIVEVCKCARQWKCELWIKNEIFIFEFYNWLLKYLLLLYYHLPFFPASTFLISMPVSIYNVYV